MPQVPLIELSWSVDGQHLYVDDAQNDERVIDIHFFDKISRDGKVSMIKWVASCLKDKAPTP